MKDVFTVVLLGLPSALLAQATAPAVAVQVGVSAEQNLDNADGRWASVGLAWMLRTHLDLAGRAEFATRTVRRFACDFNCVAVGDTHEQSVALIGELPWWSGRGTGLHAVIAPGIALQHMPSARTPFQRRDWVSPQVSAGAAWARGHHVLSGGARWRGDNQWVHAASRFSPSWWMGWQWHR
jgi:hypothetical protein